MKKNRCAGSTFRFKWNLLFLGLLALALLLSACGGSDNGERDQDDGSSSADSGGLSGEIEVWAWNIAAASLDLAAERFMEKHPDAQITVRDIGDSDLYERLTIGMGSGGSGLPDVSIIHSDELHGYLEQFPDQFLNLGEMGF